MSDFEHVLSPFTFGGRQVRNRVLITGHSVLYGQDGAFSQRHVDYYGARAKAGAAIVITEQQAAHPGGRNYRAGLKGYDPANLPHWLALTDEVRGHGALIYAQLFCGGPQGMSTQYMDDWAALHSPSGIRSTQFGEIPAVMTQADIAEVRDGFVRSALNMKQGGFDGIEVHAAHSQLLGSFLSPAFNRRTDSYGGSHENRCRIVIEILEAVREAVGPDMHVGLRLGASEHLGEAGIQEDEGLEQALTFARTGLVDFLDMSAGGYFAKSVSVPPMASPLPTGFLKPFTTLLKEKVPQGVAVFSVGRITTLDEADEMIASSACDMVGMTRAHMADQNLIEKARAGRAVTHCIGANVCAKRLVSNLPVACVLNPTMGREAEAAAQSAAHAQKVVVVGAGPAGLRAAITAARLGHSVVVLEASDKIGGRLSVLAQLPFRERWHTAIADLSAEAEEAGVEIRLGAKAALADIQALSPDRVLVATGSAWETNGATPFRPARDGVAVEQGSKVRMIGLDEAVTIVSANRTALGQHVVIVDETFDSTGAGLSILLGEAGVAVDIVTPAASYADHLFQTYELPYFMRRIEEAGVAVHAGVTLDAVAADGAVSASSLYSAKVSRLEAVDTIVFVAGRTPRHDLYDELRQAGIGATLVGDALAPRAIEAVLRDGFEAGSSLGNRSA
ncbi:MAG: FAD-dependent oxidoreductase [Mesorhizobium sp.]